MESMISPVAAQNAIDPATLRLLEQLAENGENGWMSWIVLAGAVLSMVLGTVLSAYKIRRETVAAQVDIERQAEERHHRTQEALDKRMMALHDALVRDAELLRARLAGAEQQIERMRLELATLHARTCPYPACPLRLYVPPAAA